MKYYDEKILRPILEGYCAVVNAGLDERRGKITSKYPGKEYQVVVGLMARQVDLSVQLAGNVGIWNGCVPPLIIRCMVDCFIILSWILEDVEKHSLIYLKQSYNKVESMGSAVGKAMKIMEQNLKNAHVGEIKETAQTFKGSSVSIQIQELIQQGLDDWNIKDDGCGENFPNMRQMAEYVDKKPHLYDCLFSPMSLAVHNNWHEIKSILTKDRENPFAFRMNAASAKYPGLAAILISEAYIDIDEKLELECSSDMPIMYWVEHFPDEYPANMLQ